MSKKILLIAPSTKWMSPESPPISLAVLASCLEKDGHIVKICDMIMGQNPLEMVNSFLPDIVGITATTTVAPMAYSLSSIFKSNGIYTVLGGIHPTIRPEEAMHHCNCVVTGEGENVICDIARNMPKGIIQGIPSKTLDNIPLPDYDLLNMEYYVNIMKYKDMFFASFEDRGKAKLGYLLTSRGCPYDCNFCYNCFRELPYRFESPKKVIDHIKLLNEKYKVNSIFFIEDNLFANRKRANEIMKEIKNIGFDLSWGANTRVDNINETLLKTAKQSSCKQVTFGWESGNQRILDILNKKVKVQQNIDSIKLCEKVNINASGTVMIGNPTETIDEMGDTYNFIANNNITGPIGVCIATPFPATKFWNW